MFSYFDKNHIYTAFEMQRVAIVPLNIMANSCREFYGNLMNPIAYTEMGRSLAASCELMERMTRRYLKPEFGIKSIEVDGKEVKVRQYVSKKKIFCNLLHFKKDISKKQPKLLIVAPMSGHYATLLRGTVKGLLPHFDVYITDWRNASDVPVSHGTFDLDDYIEYVMEFIRAIKGDVHVMAVCQPAVPVMAAVSLMSSEKDPKTPKSMILIGGPIDTRKNPTAVNKLAEDRPIEWFENNVITNVPFNYPGVMRRVYPGFLQLTGFMSMNLDRHIKAHHDFFNHLVEGDGESADTHKDFYNEYRSVMDVTAEYYLQTIRTVFKGHSLPDGAMVCRGRKVRPQDIKNTGVMAIEGERDDISGRNQTKAALDLCTSLPKEKKHYHLQKGVGHYGTFNGRRFTKEIVPAIKEFISKNSK